MSTKDLFQNIIMNSTTETVCVLQKRSVDVISFEGLHFCT